MIFRTDIMSSFSVDCKGEIMLESMRMVDGKMLRRGYTTGSCAAAASKAAAIMLLTQEFCHSVTLKTPKGTVLTLDIMNAVYPPEQAS